MTEKKKEIVLPMTLAIDAGIFTQSELARYFKISQPSLSKRYNKSNTDLKITIEAMELMETISVAGVR